MKSSKVAVIGGGPAGLRAAELLADAGQEVHLFDQMPSVGRKFLVAGKSGLNLTNAALTEDFLSRYTGTDFPQNLWADLYRKFTNDDLRAWAAELGQETFVSSGQKVFPSSMKAAPLLRAWVTQLKALRVKFHMRHRLTVVDADQNLTFSTSEGLKTLQFNAIFFAMGGGSWQRTGSDRKWVSLLEKLGLAVEPLTAANCGWEVNWNSAFIAQYSGQPIKNVSCSVGSQSLIGEFVITDYGVEGGPIYRLGSEIKKQDTPHLHLDFKPSFSVDQLARKMESVKKDFLSAAQQRWKLSEAVVELIRHHHSTHLNPEFTSAEELAQVVKAFSLPLLRPRPIDEAISSAGGVHWAELNADLSLKKHPNYYLCGEMLNWEAPTGGYLLQGCFTTATHAARAYLQKRAS